MAAGNQKPKSEAPVHPWDLPPEPLDGEEFEDAGPRTLVVREPLPPPKPGEVLESAMPEPDPVGPATLPGNAPEPPSAAPEPPPLTAFDLPPERASARPAFDPPTLAERPSAKLPRSGLNATEPNPVPPVTSREAIPEGTQPQAALPSELMKDTPTAATPVRKITGDLARPAEALRKTSSTPRKTTGELGRAAEQVRKATSKPSTRLPRLPAGDEAAAKKIGNQETMILSDLPVEDEATASRKLGSQETMILADADDTTRKKVPEKPPPPVMGLEPEEDEPTAERPQIAKPGAFSRRRSNVEREPTAPSADLGDPDLYERTKTGVKVMDPNAKKRLMRVVAGVAVLCGSIAVYGLYQGTRERPVHESLLACYPYGFDGMRGPHGEDAPGAEYMTYEYVDEVACTTHTICLRYRYTGQNRFTGTMVLGKTKAGIWERVGDQGSPFPPPPTRE